MQESLARIIGTVADTAAMLHRIQLVSSLPVVIIGAEANDAELVELIEAGCCGCVRRDAALADLLDAIRDVCCGRAECSPYLAALTACATLLLTPYAYPYDAVLLQLPILWLIAEVQRAWGDAGSQQQATDGTTLLASGSVVADACERGDEVG